MEQIQIYYLVAIFLLVWYFRLYKPVFHYMKLCEGYSSDVGKVMRSDVCPCGVKI